MRHSPAPRAPFRLTLCAALLGALGAPGHAQEQLAGSSFNEEFLGIGGDQPHADLSLFSFGNRVLAGKYMVDVSLNERGAGQTEIRFAAKDGKNDAEPCLTRAMLDAWASTWQCFLNLQGPRTRPASN
ncbi:outer membrane usher protein FimD/PapC [Variovorax sp. W1I1]|nr:FimD/PapC N-terminal domain-containing protein [Variovorax sp. W1I1]MDQ0611078.1 outer membrane usher protein FimD/PapC [Variovorax sp. W1I1]